MVFLKTRTLFFNEEEIKGQRLPPEDKILQLSWNQIWDDVLWQKIRIFCIAQVYKIFIVSYFSTHLVWTFFISFSYREDYNLHTANLLLVGAPKAWWVNILNIFSPKDTRYVLIYIGPHIDEFLLNTGSSCHKVMPNVLRNLLKNIDPKWITTATGIQNSWSKQNPAVLTFRRLFSDSYTTKPRSWIHWSWLKKELGYPLRFNIQEKSWFVSNNRSAVQSSLFRGILQL